MSRVSTYSQVVADSICDRLEGGESLRAICRDDDFPAFSTVKKWLRENESFSAQYARAREQQAEFYAAQIIDIADETPIKESPDPDGGVTMCVDAAGVQRNRLRVDARKWVAAKLLPKKYGDFERKEVTGPDGGAIPMSLEINL